MKTFFTIIFLTISLNLFAQDTRLFDNQWYLHNLIINGESNIPPINDEIPFVPLDLMANGQIYTGICESPGSGIVIYTGTAIFTIQGGLVILAGGCYDSDENEDFNRLYISTFWDDIVNDPYQYEIIEDGVDKTLIITNSNGDEAIYRNMLLNTEDYFTASFKIYPNPANEIVFIKKELNTTIISLKILDINGRIVFFDNQLIYENPKVNVENLKNGIYFISIEDDQNRIATKKLIKH